MADDPTRSTASCRPGIGADITDNVVTVNISSANQEAPALVVAHYRDAPSGMIRVESDGTGAHVNDWVATEGGDHPVVASVVVDVPARGEVKVRLRLPVGFDLSATP